MNAKSDDDLNNYVPKDDWDKETFIETYKSQISFILEGLKYLTLANGGAVVTLLNYLGSSEALQERSIDIVPSMALFVIALVLSVLCFFSAYLTQMQYLKFIGFQITESEKKTKVKWHKFFFGITVVLVTLSLFVFALGAIMVANELSSK